MTRPLPRIVVTAGEPAGIGLDLCAMLASHPIPAEIIVIADNDALVQRANLLGLKVQTRQADFNVNPRQHKGDGSLLMLHQPVNEQVIAGTLSAANSQYVLKSLNCAVEGCLNGLFDAMVTAPVHKGVINQAGIPFSGHTEFLAELTHTENVVMLLVGGGMRVALVTRHMPLSRVSQAITPELLEVTIRILNEDLKTKFGIDKPVIFVAGLNPHAGENGYLGTEEIEVINPVLERLRLEGIDLIGALPADTMFSQKNMKTADAFLAMYHDQGLAVLKHASFGGGVNVTLGLPIIRTSVDHGTALELAGKGNIEIGSLLSAIQLSIELAYRKQ